MKSKSRMTIKGFIKELEHWKREAAGFKHQMQVNLDYANCYESALKRIATMCGYVTPKDYTSCPEDIDSIAVKEVSRLIKELNDLNEKSVEKDTLD